MKRPPKKWMRDCIAGVKSSGRKVRDPGAVCGAQWHHKMSRSAKRSAMRRESRKRNPASGKGLLANPLVWILGGGGLALLAWRFWPSGGGAGPGLPAPGATPAIPPVPGSPAPAGLTPHQQAVYNAAITAGYSTEFAMNLAQAATP